MITELSTNEKYWCQKEYRFNKLFKESIYVWNWYRTIRTQNVNYQYSRN